MPWQDDPQRIVASVKEAAYRLYRFLTEEVGLPLAGASSKAGDWSAADNLSTGNWFAVAAGTEFPMHWLFTIAADGIDAYVAPWVGVSGGWDEGTASWGEPMLGPARLYLAPGSSNFSVVASTEALWAWGYWTPTAISGSVISGCIASHVDNSFTIEGDSFATKGFAPGTLFTFAGGSDNDGAHEVIARPSATKILVAKALVDHEGTGNFTPTGETHELLHLGVGAPYEVGPSPAFLDERPVFLAAGARHLGVSGFARHVQRVYARTADGYKKLTAGYLCYPAKPGAADGIASGPLGAGKSLSTASGNRYVESARVRFDEVVSSVTYRETGGTLAGGFLCRLDADKVLAHGGLVACHGGIGHLWPSKAALL